MEEISNEMIHSYIKHLEKSLEIFRNEYDELLDENEELKSGGRNSGVDLAIIRQLREEVKELKSEIYWLKDKNKTLQHSLDYHHAEHCRLLNGGK